MNPIKLYEKNFDQNFSVSIHRNKIPFYTTTFVYLTLYLFIEISFVYSIHPFNLVKILDNMGLYTLIDYNFKSYFLTTIIIYIILYIYPLTFCHGIVKWCYESYVYDQSKIYKELNLNKHIKIEENIKQGFLWFLVSEFLIFAGFFWCLINNIFNPKAEIGHLWPPINTTVIDLWSIPFLNTCILITSGIFITLGHHFFKTYKIKNNKKFLISEFFNIDEELSTTQRYKYKHIKFII